MKRGTTKSKIVKRVQPALIGLCVLFTQLQATAVFAANESVTGMQEVQETDVFGQVEKEKKGLGQMSGLGKGYIDSGVRVDSVNEISNDSTEPHLLKVSYIPASYDLRNVNGKSYVTPVRYQGNFGTCWAFSAAAAAESNLIRQGLADTLVDLSEHHLSYFHYNTVTDLLGGTVGDDVALTSTAADAYLTTGGDGFTTTFSLAKWIGMADEATAEYPETDSIPQPLNDGIAYEDAAHLRDAYWISMSDISNVKQAIMDNGAVESSYNHDDAYVNYDTAAIYYNGNIGYANHAITIIGWDDNYSKSNFLSGRQPANNGAWLVKNSWGTWWGNAGYCWISYEDYVMKKATAYSFVFEGSDNYDHNYQYDGGVSTSYYMYNSSCMISNVFTAHGNTAGKEILEAVSFALQSVNTNYSIQIYKNPTDSRRPTSGTAMLAEPQTGTAVYAGYHTVELNAPVTLEQGERFAVVITLSKPDGTVMFNYDYDYSYSYIDFNSNAAAGQSLVSWNDGKSWEDLSADGVTNLRIKAFTSDITQVEIDAAAVKIEGFVGRLYDKVLGRTASADEIDYYASMLIQNKITGADVGKSFVFSPEFTGRNLSNPAYVDVLYETFMGRASDAGGKAYWTNFLDNGVSRQYVFKGFVESPEYSGICIDSGIAQGNVLLTEPMDMNPNLTMFVNRLYEKALGRDAEIEGLNYYAAEIMAGRVTPVQAAQNFFFSGEFLNKNLGDEDFVKTLYVTFMGREFDQSGLDYHLARLKDGTSRETVLLGFAYSPEFEGIISSFGL